METIKKSILFLLSCLFFALNVHSQNTVIDSLKNELKHHKSKDTMRVHLLNSLAFNYNGYDIALSEEKAIEAKKLANELHFSKGKARNYIVFSEIHISKVEYDQAKDDALIALEIYEKINNYDGIASAYSILGQVFLRKHESDKSLDYYKKGLAIAKEHGNLQEQAEILKGMGNISFSKGDLEDALTIYKKSIALSDKLGDKKGSLSAKNNTAVIYTIQGRTLEALDYFNKCLIIHREENNKEGIATTTLNISGVYWEREQHEKALVYLQESLQLSKELKDKRSIAKCLVNIGAVNLDLKEYSEALKFFTEALAINEEIKNKEGLIMCHNHIGGLYIILQQPELALDHYEICLALSTFLENKIKICYSHVSIAEAYFLLKNYPKAISHGLEGKQLADDLDLIMQKKGVTHTLSKAYEAMGDYKKSLSYYQLHKAYNDTLFNKENIEKLTQLEYEYKYKGELESANNRELKLTQEVKMTNVDLEKSQRSLLLGVIAFLLIGSILGGIIFFLKFRNIKSKNENIVIEQKLLRSQMTPHFIFNSLSVLQGMILNKEDKKAVSYLSKFSKLLRIILENSRDKTVSLSQELIAVENYMALHNIEENEAYDYTLVVDPTIDPSIFKIPPMLIQPFIENSIEHAFVNQKVARKIDVHLKYLKEQLVCTITDNGCGIDSHVENKNAQKKSLATTITSERLKILSKDFKIGGSIKMEDRKKYNEQGTIVTLVIPYKKVVA